MASVIYRHSGYHTVASAARDGIRVGQEKRVPRSKEIVAANVAIFSSYIPGIGALYGMGAIHCVTVRNKGNLSNREIAFGCVRGIVSILGAGFLFAIFDALVTIHRFCCPKGGPSPSPSVGPRFYTCLTPCGVCFGKISTKPTQTRQAVYV